MMRMKEQEFDAVIATNLKGHLPVHAGCFAADDTGEVGRIVNVSSVVGLVGNAGQANYAASKAGIIGLTRAWRGR